MRHFLSAVFAAVVAAGLSTGSLSAETGETVLTLTGPGLPADGISYDMAALEAMPQVTFTTTTVWTDAAQEFSGVPLQALLDAAGVEGKLIRATALNDYAVEIPRDSLEGEAPILATRINGEHFSRRDKGPLWVVYPYDSAERFRNELVYGRSVWQLNRISVE